MVLPDGGGDFSTVTIVPSGDGGGGGGSGAAAGAAQGEVSYVLIVQQPDETKGESRDTKKTVTIDNVTLTPDFLVTCTFLIHVISQSFCHNLALHHRFLC